MHFYFYFCMYTYNKNITDKLKFNVFSNNLKDHMDMI